MQKCKNTCKKNVSADIFSSVSLAKLKKRKTDRHTHTHTHTYTPPHTHTQEPVTSGLEVNVKLKVVFLLFV